jgi:hypothetical protein
VSEFREVIRDVIADRESGTAELCKNLKTGRDFSAEVEEIEDVELNTSLGRDARERVLMHVLERAAAEEIRPQSQIQIIFYGRKTKFVVTRRKNNPGDPQVEFGLMLWTDKDK